MSNIEEFIIPKRRYYINMGGRGNSGTRNQSSISSSSNIRQDIDTFLTELENRDYGSSRKMVPATQEKEFRRIRADMINAVQQDPQIETIVFASGFTGGANNPQEYVHTTAKLNAYQRMLRSEVSSIKTDLDFGIIDEDRARLELKALKNIDAMIKDRRSRL